MLRREKWRKRLSYETSFTGELSRIFLNILRLEEGEVERETEREPRWLRLLSSVGINTEGFLSYFFRDTQIYLYVLLYRKCGWRRQASGSGGAKGLLGFQLYVHLKHTTFLRVYLNLHRHHRRVVRRSYYTLEIQQKKRRLLNEILDVSVFFVSDFLFAKSSF